jgi:hypothetical protein
MLAAEWAPAMSAMATSWHGAARVAALASRHAKTNSRTVA